jgi:hypothetical protein
VQRSFVDRGEGGDNRRIINERKDKATSVVLSTQGEPE